MRSVNRFTNRFRKCNISIEVPLVRYFLIEVSPVRCFLIRKFISVMFFGAGWKSLLAV